MSHHEVIHKLTPAEFEVLDFTTEGTEITEVLVARDIRAQNLGLFFCVLRVLRGDEPFRSAIVADAYCEEEGRERIGAVSPAKGYSRLLTSVSVHALPLKASRVMPHGSM